jgi:hypothetical protein
MRAFLQGRVDLVKALRASSLPVTHQDLELILTAVMSACAACRWPGEGFDRKRFVESLVRFSSPKLHLDYVSTGALLEMGVISDRGAPLGRKFGFLQARKLTARYLKWLRGTLRFRYATSRRRLMLTESTSGCGAAMHIFTGRPVTRLMSRLRTGRPRSAILEEGNQTVHVSALLHSTWTT